MQINPSQVSEHQNFSPSTEQDTPSPLSPNLDNSDSPEAKPSKKVFILTFVIASLILIIPGSITYYVLNRESEKIEDQVEFRLQEEEKIIENVLEEIEKEEEEILKIYENENYPQIKIEYLSGWEVKVEEEEVEGKIDSRVAEGQEWEGRVTEDYKDTLVTFSKKGYVLSIAFTGFPYITGFHGFPCYLRGELDYVRIKEGLTRQKAEGHPDQRVEDTSFYGAYLQDENYSPYVSWEESKMKCVESYGEGDYVALGILGFLGWADTIFRWTEEAYAMEETFSAKVSATLEIFGDKEDEILNEADDIILSFYKNMTVE